MLEPEQHMESLPTFSVIIAAYNAERTIGRAIESVLSQTCPAHQVVVVDDGSTDDTAKVIAGFGDSVIYYFQENAGVSAARNAGVDLADGDWLAFLDADDWYYPDRLRWHAEWIAEDPHLAFLTGEQEYRRPDGTLIKKSLESASIGRSLLEKAGGSRRVVLEGEGIGGLVEQHIGDTPTLSLRRQVFLELGGYPTRFAVSEDVHLLIRLAARSRRIGVICDPLAVYCVCPDSATRSDKLRAHTQTIAALQDLRSNLRDAPAYMHRGLEGALRRARRDLATVMLRRGQRFRAVAAVLPSFLRSPGLATARDVMSVLRGLAEDHPVNTGTRAPHTGEPG